MPCSPTLLGGYLTDSLCHPSAICPKAFGSSGTEMEAVPEGSLGAAHGAEDLSEVPGEELLPKALLHFH